MGLAYKILGLEAELRIIAGSAGGRAFQTKEGLDTRPTLARVKESIFGSLQFKVPNSNVLDLFSGSGNMGLEAASRGALRVICNDFDAKCVQIIRDNAKHLKLEDRVSVMQLDYRDAISRFMERGYCFDIAFIDAPYYKDLAQDACELLFENNLLRPNGVVVVEHDAKRPPIEKAGLMRISRSKRYGTCGVTFLCREADE